MTLSAAKNLIKLRRCTCNNHQKKGIVTVKAEDTRWSTLPLSVTERLINYSAFPIA